MKQANVVLEELVRKINGWRALERVVNDEHFFFPGYAEDLYGREWVLRIQERLGQTGWIRTKGLLHDEPRTSP
jgi:hypothetical protein